MTIDYPAPTDEQARALLWCDLSDRERSEALRDTFPGLVPLARAAAARRAADTYIDTLEHAYERAHQPLAVGDHVRAKEPTMGGARYLVTALDGEYAMLAHDPTGGRLSIPGRWTQRIKDLTVESEPA